MKDGGAAHVTDVVARLTGSEPIAFGEFVRDYAAAFIPSPVVAAAV
jgi:hypothetical protein